MLFICRCVSIDGALWCPGPALRSMYVGRYGAYDARAGSGYVAGKVLVAGYWLLLQVVAAGICLIIAENDKA